ncbi:uncharacterized protein LOC129598935 [Paramacrobiotus metropolitanus]|uniref:uncharacterized protein LOC129598935 n=1 Tax=Paramacrobiotus metropolitanus TaxID=2943436 RepID=UPI0024464E4E|nr:uncharacterized protein LOC129598935 [Paramacrobiotus metropolitanus]
MFHVVSYKFPFPVDQLNTTGYLTLPSWDTIADKDSPGPDVLKTAIIPEQGNEFPPAKIYLHTNYPDHWPFAGCYMITNYSVIEIVYTRQRFTLNGRRIENIFHEADFVKYNVVYRYGGMASDLDVFYLPQIRSLVKEWRDGKYDCLLSREDRIMNSGFFACRKGHPYIRDVLKRYRYDYQTAWLHNSGSVPLEIYSKNELYHKTLYVDTQMSNHSKYYTGPVPYKNIPAWHYYDHGCEGTESSTRNKAVNSSFWEMLHFIQAEAWQVFRFATSPSTRTTRMLATNPVGTSTSYSKPTSEPTATTLGLTTMTTTIAAKSN